MLKKIVILLIGPAGSGKISMGKRIAKNKGLIHISEDKIWDKINHPPHTARTVKEQKIVHPLSVKHIMKEIKKGKNVVFEFLVFDNSPMPIKWYQRELSKINVKVITRILRPSVDEVLKRKKMRGRKTERDIEFQRKNAEHQLNCLHSRMIKKIVILLIDPSGKTLEENYSKYFLPIIKNPNI